MATKASVIDAPHQSAESLETTFVTKEQTASLMHGLDLTSEEIDQVSGGLPLLRLPDELPDCIIAPPVPDCIIVQPADCVLA